MAIRDYQFIVGPQTSTIPTATSPSTSEDFMSKGYADSTYAGIIYWGNSVADNTALKAVASGSRFDTQIVLVDSTNKLYKFDASSTATDDGDTVLQPTSGTGRWLLSSGASGGSASDPATGLAIAELNGALQKTGFIPNQSNQSIIAEGFNQPGESTLTVSLGRDYTSGTTIWLDPDKVVIDACDSNSGWTQFGAQAGADAVDTTNKVEGTGSVTTAVSATTTENGLYKDYTAFSLGLRKLRISVRLDTTANISNIRVRLFNESGETNGKYWDKTLQSDGSALAVGWNEIEVDPDDTATGSSGTFVQGSVVRVKVSVTPSSSQAFNLNLDNIRTVDERGVPLYATHSIYNATVLEEFKLTAYSGGKGTLSSGLSNAYTISSGVIRRCLGLVDLAANNLGFLSGLAGAAAKTNRVYIRRPLNATVAGKFKWALNYWSDSTFLISTVSSTTSFKVSSTTDRSAEFKSGDVLWAFRKVWDGRQYVQTGTALRLTLSADSTYASSEITLTNSGDNTGIAANTDWYIVAESAKCKFWVGSSTAVESLAASTPDIFRFVGNTSTKILTDTFTRSTSYSDVGTPDQGNTWVSTINIDTGTGSPTAKYQQCTGTQLKVGTRYDGASDWNLAGSFSNAVPYDGQFLRVKFKAQFHCNLAAGGANYHIFGVSLRNTSTTNGTTSGVAIGHSRDYVAGSGALNSSTIFVAEGGINATPLTSVSKTVSSDTDYWFLIEQNGKQLRMKVWDATATEPTSWDLNYNYSGATAGRYWVMASNAYAVNNRDVYGLVNDVQVWTDLGSYTVSGTEVSQSGTLIAMSGEITRQDTTNSFPKLNSVSGYLG